MKFNIICDNIFRLYLYADMCKMIHYSTDSIHEHELSDTIRNTIITFTDELAESTFAFFGKPNFSDMSLDLNVQSTNNLGKLAQFVIDTVEILRSDFQKNEKLSGIVSLIDDFKNEMSKNVFLATFDKVSTYQLNK